MSTDILQFDAIHLKALQAVVKPTDSLVTTTQATELLAAPSGTRPRMYGLMFDDGRYQLVAIRAFRDLDRHPLVAQWLSGTTVADLFGRA